MAPTVSASSAVAPPASAPVLNSAPIDKVEQPASIGASAQDDILDAFQLPLSAPEAQLGYVSPWMVGEDRAGEGGLVEQTGVTGVRDAADEASVDKMASPSVVIASEPGLNPKTGENPREQDARVNEEEMAALRMSPKGGEAEREEVSARAERERISVDQTQRRLQVPSSPSHCGRGGKRQGGKAGSRGLGREVESPRGDKQKER